MKLLALVAILIVVGFTFWQRNHFLAHTQPRLLEEAAALLEGAGYPVRISAPGGMEVELDGLVPNPADRFKVQALVDSIRGLRVTDQDNHLKAPGLVELHREAGSGELRLSGRLSDPEAARILAVKLQELDTIDVVTADALHFDEVLVDPRYLDEPPFLDLAAAFFAIPGNGRLVATEAGLWLEGFSTTRMEADWKVIERELGAMVHPDVARVAARLEGHEVERGGFRVHTRVKPLASDLHAPGRQPEAPLAPERLADLENVLRRSEVVFPPGSIEIRADQTGKLELAARAMVAAGPRVSFAVGGHFPASAPDSEANGEPVARKQAEAVAGRLTALGVDPDQLFTMTFGIPDGAPEAPARSGRVEIRVR